MIDHDKHIDIVRKRCAFQLILKEIGGADKSIGILFFLWMCRNKEI